MPEDQLVPSSASPDFAPAPQSVPSGGLAPPSPAPAPAPAPLPEASPAGDTGFTSIRDYVSGLGLTDLASQHQDDESVVNFLVQQHRNAQQSAHLAPYAQRYLQHAQAFEQFLAQQQQVQQQAQVQQKRWWNPPDYNPSWSRFVARDDQGNLALVPGSGATQDILPKVAAYEQYVRDFVHRFTNNPQDTLSPMIEEVVQPLLERHLQHYMGSFQERSAAREFLGGNSNWLYQGSQNGAGPVRDGNGNLVLSENGQIFANLVYEAEQMGLDTVAKQQRYAARVLAAAGRYGVPGGVQQTQQQPVASVNDQLKQQFLHRPNPAGAIGLSSPTPQPTQDGTNLSLADLLRRNLASGGINDNVLAADSR